MSDNENRSEMTNNSRMNELTPESNPLNKYGPIHILKKQNELCCHANKLQKYYLEMYENTIKIQIVLFALFILVLFWLLYHYSYGK